MRGELVQLDLLPKQTAPQRKRFAELVDQIDARWKSRGAIERSATRWKCTPAQFVEHASAAFADEPLIRGAIITFANRDGLKQAATSFALI